MDSVRKLQQKASSRMAERAGLRKKTRKLKDGTLDTLFEDAHRQAESEVNCLDCAQCCKTISPRFENRDIERLASHFKMKPGTFVSNYLKLDDDGDYVLQQSPCPFLMPDNACMVYDHRPKACRQYPHTNHKPIRKVMNLTLKNAEICPIVDKVLDRVAAQLLRSAQ